MTPRSKEALNDGLMAAMRAEHEGYHFYTMAAEKTADKKGCEVFTQLAEDERQHLDFLKRQYRALNASGRSDAHVTLGPTTQYAGSSPIFSDSIRDRIKGAHFEMTALSIGIQLELGAVKHYQALAEQASDPTVKQFFEELAAWEQGHYHALLSQQEALQEDYWAENDFAPF